MPKLVAHNCGRCGKKLRYPNWVRSNWNNAYYCTDIDACGKRAKRLKAKTTKEEECLTTD